MRPKHKIGEVVRVRKDLKIDVSYNGKLFTKEMDEFKGRELKIEDVVWDDYNKLFVYEIKNQEFTNQMFE